MPFGLKNAAQSFQRLMDGILRDVSFAFVYLDDILVAIQSPQEHLQHLKQMFTLLSANGLIINKVKYVFGTDELGFSSMPKESLHSLTGKHHFKTVSHTATAQVCNAS